MREFLQYLEDFEEAEECIGKWYFRNNFHGETEREFVNGVERVVGRNYTMSLWQLLKELNHIDVATVSKTQLKIKSCNTSLYPTKWKKQPLSLIVSNKEVHSILSSHTAVKEIIKHLTKW